MKREKVYIETFGCQMNVSDTERVSGQLLKAGFDLAASAEAADVVLLNTCSVRSRPEQKVYTRIGELRQAGARPAPLIGVLGCVAQLEGGAIFEHAPAVGLVAGTQATDRVPQLIERALGGERRVLDTGERQAGEEWDVSPAERRSRHVAFVPIIEGCNKFCTYCIVPFSRGRERSRAAGDVVEEVRRLSAAGYKEVHLIGQNVNSYRPKTEGGLEGFEGATPFARLLRAVAATGVPRVKFTTSFPRDFHADIVAAIDENDNLCNWVHLPVQSGSDRVLKAMRRGHKASDYLARVESVKGARKDIALTSDIIVGFPGETRSEFEETLELVARCRYDGLYIFKYSPRKGTPAASLEDSVDAEEKRARFQELEDLQRSIQRGIYAGYVGRVVGVLVEGESSRSAEDLTGHTTCHKVVNFKGGGRLAGQLVDVRITESKANSLYGEAVGAS
jgi:tRNA-2-methylthio-N6-dimethylallyladenosine synthase